MLDARDETRSQTFTYRQYPRAAAKTQQAHLFTLSHQYSCRDLVSRRDWSSTAISYSRCMAGMNSSSPEKF